MAGIKLPIEVGQKFLSDGLEVVIISVTGKVEQYPVIDDYGDRFGLDGQHEVHRRLNLQPSPVVITEGVEFSGEQYRAEFERLVADGREFEIEIPNTSRWVPSTAFESPLTYRLLPQHRDANNNPLKVGDRVRVDGVDGTITEFDGDVASTDRMTFGLRACRKLATRTRPLCKADLDKAPRGARSTCRATVGDSTILGSLMNAIGDPLLISRGGRAKSKRRCWREIHTH